MKMKMQMQMMKKTTTSLGRTGPLIRQVRGAGAGAGATPTRKDTLPVAAYRSRSNLGLLLRMRSSFLLLPLLPRVENHYYHFQLEGPDSWGLCGDDNGGGGGGVGCRLGRGRHR